MKRYLKNFNESTENLNKFIKNLQTDDSEIIYGDYFLEVGEYRFIHKLVEDDDDYEDYKLPNGIEVVPFRKSDLEWNSRNTKYRKILNFL